MIFYSFIPSMITIFWAQIPYQLLEGELQGYSEFMWPIRVRLQSQSLF